jgi:hypothetical protein
VPVREPDTSRDAPSGQRLLWRFHDSVRPHKVADGYDFSVYLTSLGRVYRQCISAGEQQHQPVFMVGMVNPLVLVHLFTRATIHWKA